MSQPIHFYNRETGQIETEAVYGERFLRLAYGNPLGRLTVELAIKRAWFSRWYGWRMDKASSRAKIAPFIEEYGLDAGDFANSSESYASFNEFFYRKLKTEARPIEPDPNTAVFPADGRHLAIQNVSAADTFYIKGQQFNLKAFLADDALAEAFEGGGMLISRLCPVDYHRYHFAVSGQAEAPTLINGPLYSVSPLALRRRLAIFWENKRSLTVIDSPIFGKVVMMEVGATCVGSMHSTYVPGPVEKGEEKGYFSFGGSCLITLYQQGRFEFSPDLLEHAAKAREVYAKVGQSCGRAC